MNNKNWLIIGVVVLVALGVWFYFDSREGVGLGPEAEEDSLPDWPFSVYYDCGDVKQKDCGTFGACNDEVCCDHVFRCRVENLLDIYLCQLNKCDGLGGNATASCRDQARLAYGARLQIIIDASDRCITRVLSSHE